MKVLYKNNDWVYVVSKSGEAGYVPYNYLRPSRKYNRDLPEAEAEESPTSPESRLCRRPAKSLRPTLGKPIVDTFVLEELVVIHDFDAQEEDEVAISKGERLKVMNAEDPFWLWIETTTGMEGFVPRSCCSLGNHPCKYFNLDLFYCLCVH